MNRRLQWYAVQLMVALDLILILYLVRKVAVHTMDNMVLRGFPEKIVMRYRYARTVERRSFPCIPPKTDPISLEEVLIYLKATPMGYCSLCSSVHAASIEFCPEDKTPLYQMSDDEFLAQARVWETFRATVSTLLDHTITRQNALWLWHMKERPMIEH